jgi:hypothetical protein
VDEGIEITWQLVRDLGPDLRGRRLARPTVGPRGEAVGLAMPPGGLQRVIFVTGGPVPVEEVPPPHDPLHLDWLYPEHMAAPYSADVLVWGTDGVSEVALEDVAVEHPMVQTFSDGAVLLVSSLRRNDDNARVYSPRGQLLGTFALGDAIQHVAVGAGDSIWVGYFDEGIYGEDPLSHSGVARFDRDGRKEWGFNENRGDAPFVDSCYALSVGPGGAWTCSYSEFDLVNIRGNDFRSWKQPIRSVVALALGADRVLLHGSEVNRVGDWLGRLSEDAVEDVRRVTLRLPDGRELSEVEGAGPDRRPYRVVGSGSSLHAFVEDCWYRIDAERL